MATSRSIELAAPDLPWVLTPAVADDAADGRLRPWLVLVCVEDTKAELVRRRAPTVRRRLSVPVVELPDLAESYAWAHVQSIAAPDDVIGSLSAPGTVVARLVCPRRLAAGT